MNNVNENNTENATHEAGHDMKKRLSLRLALVAPLLAMTTLAWRLGQAKHKNRPSGSRWRTLSGRPEPT